MSTAYNFMVMMCCGTYKHHMDILSRSKRLSLKEIKHKQGQFQLHIQYVRIKCSTDRGPHLDLKTTFDLKIILKYDNGIVMEKKVDIILERLMVVRELLPFPFALWIISVSFSYDGTCLLKSENPPSTITLIPQRAKAFLLNYQVLSQVHHTFRHLTDRLCVDELKKCTRPK